jgi:dihydrofolate reductase
MGKIIISENVTLDGVVEDPTGDEGSAHGGWFAQAGDSGRQAWAALMLEEARSAQALLLGRRSDEWFATRWLRRTGEWADRLNSMPKYVVSSSLREPAWGNSSVLAGDVTEQIAKLRQELAGDLVVYASLQLARTLIEHDLADELRLTVYPVAAGAGRRLLDESRGTRPLHLEHARTLGGTLVFLRYTF